MSVEADLLKLLLEFDILILRCKTMHLPEAAERVQVVRDAIQLGMEKRQALAEREAPK